jgi:hypothetical protein
VAVDVLVVVIVVVDEVVVEVVVEDSEDEVSVVLDDEVSVVLVDEVSVVLDDVDVAVEVVVAPGALGEPTAVPASSSAAPPAPPRMTKTSGARAFTSADRRLMACSG